MAQSWGVCHEVRPNNAKRSLKALAIKALCVIQYTLYIIAPKYYFFMEK